jgi:glycosyltransferase involved in cell wall biosynthesis
MNKNSQPEWTIIIRTQGKRNKTLLRALKSVAAQTYTSKSVLISFHSADDEYYSNIKALARQTESELNLSIKLVRADSAQKRGHAINIALDNCKTKYVSILDDDDNYLPNMGEDLIKALEETEANLVYGNTLVVEHKESVADKMILHQYKGYGEEFNPIRLVAENYIHLSGCIYDLSEFQDIRTSEEIDMWEDWYLLLEILFSNKLKGVYINSDVSKYHVVAPYTSNTFHKRGKKEIERAYQIIESAFSDRRLSIAYEDVFKVYPRQSLVFNKPNNSDIQKLRNKLQTFRRIKNRKSFQFLQKIFKW